MKKYLSKKELIKERGVPESLLEAALHGKYAASFARKLTDAPNSKWMINVEEFEKLLENGAI